MTTTPAQAPGTCPPSAVVDQIIPWAEVREGDLVLWNGELRLITRLIDYDGEPLMWFDGSKTGGGVLPCGNYAAVRRYAEGGVMASPAEELRAAAKRIRADASWPSEALMLALGDHLDAVARVVDGTASAEAGELPDACRTALKVARACLGSEGSADDD
jgi:hypothetical protein